VKGACGWDRTTVPAVSLAVLIAVLSGCGGGAPRPAAPAAPAQGQVPTSSTQPASALATVGVAPPLRVILNWTAPVNAQTPLWVAQETGIFREQGLDVEMVNVPVSARVIQAMVAGEIHLSPLDSATGVQARLGGADLVLLLGVGNRFPFAVMSDPGIKEPQALRGKSLGITRVGSVTHSAALVALQSWGLAADHDVALRNLGETPAIIAALESGQIEAGIITVPVPSRVQANHHELINLVTQGPEYAASSIGALGSWITANEETVRRFVRSYVLGIQRARSDKPTTLAAYRKYIQVEDPEALDATYAAFMVMVSTVPYVSESGLARLLGDLARVDPRLADLQPSEFTEPRFVRELEDSGFLNQVLGSVR
jgi:NitT/TauT family transport system substrate-binding protein